MLVAFSSFEATFALFSEHQFGFTSTTIGYMFAWIGVVLATVQGALVGRVAKRVGEQRIVPAAIVVIATGLALIAASGSVPALALASGVLALGMGFNSPSMLSAISQLADPRDQGARSVCRSPSGAWRALSARCGEGGSSINLEFVYRSSRHPP